MKRRGLIVGILLLTAVIGGYATGTAQAQTISESDFITEKGDWNGEGIGVVGYKGSETDVEIPKYIGGAKVTRVKITDNKQVEKLTIPAGVLEIRYLEDKVVGENPFNGCENLKEIVVAKDNKWFASEGGLLLSKDKSLLLAVPPGYEGVCNIPAKVKDFGFHYEKFGNLRRMDEYGQAFYGVNKVTAYTVDGKSTSLKAVNGVLYSKNGKNLYAYPGAAAATEFQIPSGVRTIGKAAFYQNQNLEKVVCPEGVITIGWSAFERCEKLKEITLKKGIRTIGNNAFYKSANLEKCNFPLGLETIERTSFDGTKVVLTSKKRPKVKDIKVTRKKLTNKQAVKGSGKSTTKWYKKGKKTYYISTPDELAGLAKLEQKKGVSFSGKTIVLKRNLDMSCYKNWQPIKYFDGTFQGNGKTIYNLTCKYQNKCDVGLFGTMFEDGVIKNLKVKNAAVLGYVAVGGLVGSNAGKIINCSFSGKVAGRMSVGGIVGEVCTFDGKKEPFEIKNCVNKGTVNGASSVGGIVGGTWDTDNAYVRIKNCVNNGRINGYFDIGGIAGYLRSRDNLKLTKCKNTGKISAYYHAVGIANWASDEKKGVKPFVNCKNTGKIKNLFPA